MKLKCPCHGCTEATGRRPGCHDDSCPHGWAEYHRSYIADKEKQRKARRDERAIEGLAMDFRKTKTKRK